MTDYPHIVAWGRMLGSYDDYIQDQVALARADNAPPTAIYKHQDESWATFDEVTSHTTRAMIAPPPQKGTVYDHRARRLCGRSRRTPYDPS
jgi:hypothetical protein